MNGERAWSCDVLPDSEACPEPAAYFVEWDESDGSKLAATACEAHTASLRAGVPAVPGWSGIPTVVYVVSADLHRQHVAAARAFPRPTP